MLVSEVSYHGKERFEQILSQNSYPDKIIEWVWRITKYWYIYSSWKFCFDNSRDVVVVLASQLMTIRIILMGTGKRICVANSTTFSWKEDSSPLLCRYWSWRKEENIIRMMTWLRLRLFPCCNLLVTSHYDNNTVRDSYWISIFLQIHSIMVHIEGRMTTVCNFNLAPESE